MTCFFQLSGLIIVGKPRGVKDKIGRGYGFLKKEGVVARRAFFARRSNLQDVKGIVSGWKEHPAFATTHKSDFVDHS